MTDVQTLDLNNFVLEKADQFKVQTYVEAGVNIPSTSTAMKVYIENNLRGGGLETEVTEEEVQTNFDQLLTVYGTVNSHCRDFKTRIYPKTVQMADNLAHYGSIAHINYQGILETAYAWLDGTYSADEATAVLQDLAANLETTAKNYAGHVSQVKQDIVQFCSDTKADQESLNTVNTTYTNNFNLAGDNLKQIQADIDVLNVSIASLQSQYEQACIVAGTSPTYLLLTGTVLPILGPIGLLAPVATAIVAGIFGKQATDLLTKIDGEKQKIAQETEELQKALALKNLLDAGDNSLVNILDKLNAAIPVLETIQALWTELASKAAEIPSVIEQNIINGDLAQSDTAYMGLIDRWKILANAAGKYRDTAYIRMADVDLEKLKENPEAYLDIDPSIIQWEDVPEKVPASV